VNITLSHAPPIGSTLYLQTTISLAEAYLQGSIIARMTMKSTSLPDL
jgi:hypothetical protein